MQTRCYYIFSCFLQGQLILEASLFGLWDFFIWVSKILILNCLKFIDNEKKSVINTFILP